MRLTGKSYRDLMNEQKRYNLVTRDGAEGAMRSNIAFSNLRTVWSSAVDQIAGKLGGDLAPMVTKLADELSDWFKNGGIEVIASTIRNSWIPALIEFGNGLITFSKVAIRIAKWLGQFVPDENTDRRAIVHALASGDVDKARSVAKEKGESSWLESVISDPEKVGKLKDIYHDTQWSMSKDRFTNPWQYWTKAEDKMLSAVGGDKTAPDPVMSEFWKALKSAAGPDKEKSTVTDNRRNNIYMTVNGSPGQDAKSIADNAVTQIGKLDVFNGNNAMYDAPGGWSG
ncbi:Uncharacterised protein [Serratia rubidaea]|uniref:Phage-related minor tail protein n=2 Tax=Serratia rubidaea TaxID=61652 RepID=A0A4U9HET6_SERRU|nr:Uncharacterised protein [Serratia rubidaea]